MQRIFHVLKRAAAAGPHEWSFRARQAAFTAHNWVASHRGSAALPHDGHLKALRVEFGELGTWWSARRNAWFLDVESEKALQRAAAHESSHLPWVLRQADLVSAGKMPLLAHEPVEFSGQDRWHRDFILSRSAPIKPYHQIHYLDVAEVGDSKHVWEPNRFGWAFWLGIAHRVTRDPKYAEAFASLSRDWFDANPYPFGINYCSALEVAFRNYAWLWSLSLFSDFFHQDIDLLGKILQGIWTGCRHIERNLSYYFSANTHLTGEALALFACGAAIPDFANSPTWRRLGQSILAAEAKRQFHDDGTHRELSSGYHIYSTDFYLHASLISIQTGFQIPPIILKTAIRAGTRLRELSPPDFVLPQLNDCDGGRLTPLVANPLDAAPSLQATQILLRDDPILATNTPLRGYPLLMQPRHSWTRFEGVPTPPPKVRGKRNIAAMYDSGIVVYQNKDQDYLLFRASPFGYGDCPHSHDAPLGVILHLGGTPVIVDRGTASYTQSDEVRNQFRCAAGKNTLLVNKRGPSRSDTPFTWSRTTDCELLSLQRFADGMRVVGRHSGFSDPSKFHVFVQREVIALDSGIIAIVDSWDADDKVSVHAEFTLHPDIIIHPARKMLQVSEDGTSIHVLTANLTTREEQPLEWPEVAYSATYGQLGKTRAIVYERVARRQKVATIFSRVGAPSLTSDGRFLFEETTDVHIEITRNGLAPRKSVTSSVWNSVQTK